MAEPAVDIDHFPRPQDESDGRRRKLEIVPKKTEEEGRENTRPEDKFLTAKEARAQKIGRVGDQLGELQKNNKAEKSGTEAISEAEVYLKNKLTDLAKYISTNSEEMEVPLNLRLRAKNWVDNWVGSFSGEEGAVETRKRLWLWQELLKEGENLRKEMSKPLAPVKKKKAGDEQREIDRLLKEIGAVPAEKNFEPPKRVALEKQQPEKKVGFLGRLKKGVASLFGGAAVESKNRPTGYSNEVKFKGEVGGSMQQLLSEIYKLPASAERVTLIKQWNLIEDSQRRVKGSGQAAEKQLRRKVEQLVKENKWERGNDQLAA